MPTNPLSALSYTNKDFQSVYVELLELVKQLTKKWDPSISNESDPGVILLKLNAIIADKNNYNIDKNILEAFPDTVTQLTNARNMYRQLAYNMKWYRSATTRISMKWVGDDIEEGTSVVIPKFTMVANEDASVVYTTTQEVSFTSSNKVLSVPVTQGMIHEYSINNSNVVDVVNLDSSNRLFLNDFNVAQNGVFITNVDAYSNIPWEEVDNLATKSLGNKYYEFGVDDKNSVCYIVFPEDINDLVKSGLNVKYLTSDGLNGNVSAREIDRFYQETSVQLNGESVVLNTDIVQIYNPNAAVDGKDPETVEEASRNYKKTAGTFNTLVTLRDYINAIYNSELVSNGYVCDRLNDIQSSYQVITDDKVEPLQVYFSNDGKQIVSYKSCVYDEALNKGETFFTYEDGSMKKVEEEESLANGTTYYQLYSDESNNDLSSFDLRMYLLHTPGRISTIDDYESTFEMEPSSGLVARNVQGYISEEKCIQHDFKDIIGDIPCMYQNSYPVKIKIVPQYRLTDVQKQEVTYNIVKALWQELNSRQTEFGVEPDYNHIYNVIEQCDERIKVVIMDEFYYTTYAIYWDGSSETFKRIPVSHEPLNVIHCLVGEVYDASAANRSINYYVDGSSKLSDQVLDRTYFIIDDEGEILSSKNPEQKTQVKKNDIVKYNTKTKTFELYSTFLEAIRLNIITKSILAGKTPLYIEDSVFEYTIDQKFEAQPEASKVSTVSVISPFANKNGEFDLKTYTNSDDENSELQIVIPEVDTELVEASYQLKDNESIRFLAPSFISKEIYSTYTKYVAKLKSNSGKERIRAISSGFDTQTYYYVKKEDFETLKAYWEDALVKYEGSSDPAMVNLYKQAQTKLNVLNNNWGVPKKENTLYDGMYEGTLSVIKYSDTSASAEAADPILEAFDEGSLIIYQSVVDVEIPANSEYQLEEGEYIAFFWRSEDGADAPWNYKVYRGNDNDVLSGEDMSPVIKPSFTIHSYIGMGIDGEFSAIIGEDATLISKIDKLYGTGYIFSGDNLFDDITKLHGSNDLSGSNQIDIREINQQILDPTKNKIYFITRNKTNDSQKYEIPFEVDKNRGYARYSLQSGEYFIHTDRNFTEYEILGAGTMIGINFDKDIEFDLSAYSSVTAVPYTEIISMGIDRFAAYCISPPAVDSETKMFIREQQMYNIVANDEITLRVTDENSYISYNPSFEQSRPYFCSWADTIVSGFEVSYKTGSETVVLPQIKLKTEEALWRARATLNLYCGNGTPQKIVPIDEDHKSVQQFVVNTDTSDVQCFPDFTPENSTMYSPENIYIQSDNDLNKVGGLNVDVTVVNLASGNTEQTIFYIYKMNESIENDTTNVFYKDKDDNSLILRPFESLSGDSDGKDVSSEIVVTAVFPSGKFILPVVNTGEAEFGVSQINAVGTEIDLVPMNSSTQKNGEGKYYYKFDTPGSVSLKFTFTESTKDVTTSVYPLFNYKVNEVLKDRYGFDYEIIEGRLKELDKENKFKYDNRVDKTLAIEDPLVAKTLFDTEHILNPFTISKAELRISDATTSSIDIIQNR